MNSLLIDDEPSARSRLRRLLKSHPEIEVVGEACDGLEAVEKIETLRPDLVFLDVEMPGLNGFEVLRTLSPTAFPLVIFVTGFDRYALAAFEANALAYLLKPLEPERLAAALDRARRLHRPSSERKAAQASLQRVADEAPLRHLVCRKHGRLHLVSPGDVCWFEVVDGIVRARIAHESFAVNYQLSELERALAGGSFFRARREALVNLDRVREIRPSPRSGFQLVMGDAAASEITVSERQAPILRRRLPGL